MVTGISQTQLEKWIETSMEGREELLNSHFQIIQQSNQNGAFGRFLSGQKRAWFGSWDGSGSPNGRVQKAGDNQHDCG